MNGLKYDHIPQPGLRASIAAIFLMFSVPVTATDGNSEDMDAWRAAAASVRASGAIRPAEDAAGAVDGVVERRFSFHTGEDESPFWQADLGEIRKLGRVVIHNRHIPERAARLEVLLSSDAAEWRKVYAHDGSITDVFDVDPGGIDARHVRLQLPERGYLHLAEVEIFEIDSDENIAFRQPATQSSASSWSTRSAELDVVVEDVLKVTVDPLLQEAERQGTETGALRDERHRLIAAAVPVDDPRWAELLSRTRKLQGAITERSRQKLLEHGIKELVFVRRQTINARHVYTEHDEGDFRPGGGLCVLNLETGDVREIIPDFTRTGVVNRFDISYDARRIVFDFKPSASEGYRIYEVNVDGTGLRQLTDQDESAPRKTDDMQPCYLPDGGIAFVTTRPRYGVLCDSGDRLTVTNLWRMDGDGGNMRPLTNSALNEQSPTMLPDGRILYKRWEYVDKSAGNVKGLWAVRPDGSFSVEIYGNEIAFPETMIYGRAIPGAPGKIVFLGASHYGNNAMGTVIVLDTNDDPRRPETMRLVTDDIHALAHTGFHFRDEEGRWVHDEQGVRGRLFKDPYPINENLFITVYKPQGIHWADPRGYELTLLDGDGMTMPLYRDQTISVWHPYPLLPREKPPVVEMISNEGLAAQGLAQVILSDVYQGMPDVPRGTIRYIRVLEQLGRPWEARKNWGGDGLGHAHSAVGDGSLSVKIQHGVVPVEEDGSANFLVPAMGNIYFQALDEHYMAVQTQRTYVNYMPGEMRSCLGCHAERGTTITKPKPPAAAMRPPVMAIPQQDEEQAAKVFDYERQIQPIWERHCVECHNASDRAGGLNLEGTPQGVYSQSYNQLVALGRTDKQLLGFRSPRNEDAAFLGQEAVQSLPPYALGSPTSPLAAFLGGGRVTMRDARLQQYADQLRESHADISVDRNEFLLIVNWLDVNALFHPSYWGRLNAQYHEHPHYRPEVTVEEALKRKVPLRFRLDTAAAGN